MPTYGNKNFRNIGTGGTNIYQRLSSGGGSGGSGGSGSGTIAATMWANCLSVGTGIGGVSSQTQGCSDPVNFPFIGESAITGYYQYYFMTFKNNTSSYAILTMDLQMMAASTGGSGAGGELGTPSFYKVSVNSINSTYGGNEPQNLGVAQDSYDTSKLYFCLVEPQAAFGLLYQSDSNSKGSQPAPYRSEASILSNIGGYTGDQLFASHSDLTNIWTEIGVPTNSQVYIADVYG